VTSVLERIADGDQAAVQDCIDQYGGLIWSIARRFLRDRAEADDAVQQVFVEIWKSAGRFDGSLSSEKNFVAMIARRHLISRLRRAVRQPEQVSLQPEIDVVGDVEADVERSAEASKAAEVLRELKPDQRRMIELSVYYGLSHGEIAEVTQAPIGTVKSHIRRGLTTMRERLTAGSPAKGRVS
jgi:RNA polymerase sigma-70 factor (ECF subfamily)